MEQSKVYFSDLRAPVGTNLLRKLEKLIRRAGIGDIDMETVSYTHLDVYKRQGG